MGMVKLNFTIPEEVAYKLRQLVSQRKRSAFVAVAVQEKLQKIEEERIEQDLIEGYIERREEDMELNEEWEAITLEGWPK